MSSRGWLASLLMAAQLAGLIPAPALAQPPTPGAQTPPHDPTERGLWMQADELERDLKKSPFVIRDPELNQYVRGVLCRTVKKSCEDVRLYLLRSPEFNAAMMPNGTMLVFSGLFLRVQSEAQLAAILGHEYTHFTNRHSVRGFKDVKAKANAAQILAVLPVPGVAAAAAISLAQLTLIGSAFTFSREMEREADAGSIPLMAEAGYDPAEAHRIWEQIRAEADATAAARNTKSRKDKNGGMFATHPSSAERLAALRSLAAAQPQNETAIVGRETYHRALLHYWPEFVDDQIKLNDLGGTDLLLDRLASASGWTPMLLFARGELYRARGTAADLVKAAEFYRQALAGAEAPAEAWRGLGLALLRAGQPQDGRAALKTYLELHPDAKDRAMIVMLAGEQS